MNIAAAIAPTLFIRLRSEPVSSRICGHRSSEGASKSFSGMPYISCPMIFAINSGPLWGQKISVAVRVREGHYEICCFNQGFMSIGLMRTGWVIQSVGALYSRSKHLICALSYGEVLFVSVLATNHDPNDHDHFLVVPRERRNHGAIGL